MEEKNKIRLNHVSEKERLDDAHKRLDRHWDKLLELEHRVERRKHEIKQLKAEIRPKEVPKQKLRIEILTPNGWENTVWKSFEHIKRDGSVEAATMHNGFLFAIFKGPSAGVFVYRERK